MRHTGMHNSVRWVIASIAVAATSWVSSSTPVEAGPVYPDCSFDDVVDEDGPNNNDTDVDCLPYSDSRLKPVVQGVFGQGNLTIRTSFTLPACDLYTETRSCYFSVSRPRFDSCVYIDPKEPKGVQSCGGYADMYLPGTITTPSDEHFVYTSGTATRHMGATTQLRCSGSYDTVYGFGGDARTDFVWRTRGPNLANCDIEVNLPTPNKLQGATFLRVTSSARVCLADSGGNCSKSETVQGYAWLPVSGTLDPAIEDEVDDPPEIDEEPIEPTDPERIADTRENGETGDGEAEGEGLVEGGTSREIAVSGRAGVPDGATGVIVNVTTVGGDDNGYVTVYPCDSPLPSTSSVNFRRGQVVANSAIVQLSGDGDMCVYASTDVHVIVDVTSYVGSDGTITTIVPTRLLETREGNETDDGEFEGMGPVDGDDIIKVDVAGRGDVPDDADAVAMNVTLVRPDDAGFATVFPCTDDDGSAGNERPQASNVNYGAGEVRSNSAIVQLGDDGAVCVYTSAAADILIDVTAAIAESDEFGGVRPARVLETRTGPDTVDGESAGIGKPAAGSLTEVRVAGRGGVPDDADVVAINITAVRPDGKGYVSVVDPTFGCGDLSDVPTTSALNFDLSTANSSAYANSGVFPLSESGTLCLYAHESTHLLVDVGAFGYDDDI